MQEESPNPAQSSGPREAAGPNTPLCRYLTCDLAGESYGIPVLCVREIMPVPHVTRVPGTVNYLKGVINLRGRVVPAIDLRLRLGLPETPCARETCVVIVETAQTLAGLIADRAGDVVAIAEDSIEPPPRIAAGAEASFVAGTAKADDRTCILLDCEEILRGGYDAGQHRASRPAVLQVR